MTFTSPGYRALKEEWSLTEGDKWGDTMSWWFAVAETLYHFGYELPREWEFRDSPLHDDDTYLDIDDGYEITMLYNMFTNGEVESDDLLLFGHVLFRYANLLRLAGQDY